jgi:hypothetical protein
MEFTIEQIRKSFAENTCTCEFCRMQNQLMQMYESVLNTTITVDVNMEGAIECLKSKLKTDADYRNGWKANIAVAFQDEIEDFFTMGNWVQYLNHFSRKDAHDVSNRAAENFLNNLCR